MVAPGGQDGAEKTEQESGNHQAAQRAGRGRNVKSFPMRGYCGTHQVDCSPGRLPNSVPNGGYRLCDSESGASTRVKEIGLAMVVILHPRTLGH